MRDKVIRVRIDEEMYEALGEGNKSERIRELINKGLGKKGKAEKSAYAKEIKSMCDWGEISEEEFYKGVYDRFVEGDIVIEDGEVGVTGDMRLLELERVCKERGLDVSRELEGLVERIECGN